MNESTFDRGKKSEISSNSSDDTKEGTYENYRKSLPEGYTPYRKTSQVDENAYDRYESDYEGAETPDREKDKKSCASKKTCCKIGRLSFVTIWSFKVRVGQSRN